MIAERQLFALENSFLVCSHGSNATSFPVSLILPLQGGGKMRDTGNEVGSNAEEGRKAEGDNWFIVAPRARQQ